MLYTVREMQDPALEESAQPKKVNLEKSRIISNKFNTDMQPVRRSRNFKLISGAQTHAKVQTVVLQPAFKSLDSPMQIFSVQTEHTLQKQDSLGDIRAKVKVMESDKKRDKKIENLKCSRSQNFQSFKDFTKVFKSFTDEYCKEHDFKINGQTIKPNIPRPPVVKQKICRGDKTPVLGTIIQTPKANSLERHLKNYPFQGDNDMPQSLQISGRNSVTEY